jgi:hypothetical protein
MEIGVVDTNSEKPIIWLGDYKSEYYQYDSIKIPFRVFDPKNSFNTTITLFKDSTKIGTRTITDTTSFSIWEIVDADLNAINNYSISATRETEALINHNFRVLHAVFLYLYSYINRRSSKLSKHK